MPFRGVFEAPPLGPVDCWLNLYEVRVLRAPTLEALYCLLQAQTAQMSQGAKPCERLTQ